jgi:DNA-binding winged helix-turn-helix (wHTH) protein/tetratricopeptide (TPR) repeat protein/TolB-like protein
MTLDGEFQLGDRTVRPLTNTVVGPEGETHVEPKAMQVLAFLAERAGRVVSKHEILAEVWKATFVSEEVLPNAIWELRKALGDDAKRPRFIQTLPKTGYRLIARVRPAEDSEAIAATATEVKEAERGGWARSWIAVAVILAVSGAAFLLYSFKRGAEGSAERLALAAPYSVLVKDFENHASSDEMEWLSRGIPTMLRTGLAEVSGVHVVSDAGAASPRADAIVVGSIFKQGAEYRVDVQVESVGEARILAAHGARGEDIFAIVDELTVWVRDTLHVDGEHSETPVQPLRDMTTTSLEAFRLYQEGVEARRHLRLKDAQRLLTEAVAIDPAFALAYFELQWISLWENDVTAHKAYRLKVLENRERLPPQRQALLDASEVRKENPARAEELLKEVIARQPQEQEAYLELSRHYRSTRRFTESLEVLERGVSVIPHSGYLRLYYGYEFLWQQRYPEAIHQFETYSRINPEEANPWDSLGEAYVIAGIPERALEKYARALEVDPEFTASRLGRAWAFGQLGRYAEALSELDAIRTALPPHVSPGELLFFRAYLLSRAGRYREAEAILSRLEDESTRPPDPGLPQALVPFRALLDIERGRTRDGLARIEHAPSLAPESVKGYGSRELAALGRLLGGIAACRSGDLPQAKKYLAELGELHDAREPRQLWWYHLLLGEVALASGDAQAAYSAFNQGEPSQKLPFNVTQVMESLGSNLSFRDGAARAKAMEGDRRTAAYLYRELLKPDIGQKWTAVLEPRFYLALARLERDEGQREEAARQYRMFLELWSEADPTLPEIEEAESYLASQI